MTAPGLYRKIMPVERLGWLAPLANYTVAGNCGWKHVLIGDNRTLGDNRVPHTFLHKKNKHLKVTNLYNKCIYNVHTYIHYSIRYDLGSEHAREKDRYAAKEREEVIRRSRERKVADTKVCRFV